MHTLQRSKDSLSLTRHHTHNVPVTLSRCAHSTHICAEETNRTLTPLRVCVCFLPQTSDIRTRMRVSVCLLVFACVATLVAEGSGAGLRTRVAAAEKKASVSASSVTGTPSAAAAVSRLSRTRVAVGPQYYNNFTHCYNALDCTVACADPSTQWLISGGCSTIDSSALLVSSNPYQPGEFAAEAAAGAPTLRHVEPDQWDWKWHCLYSQPSGSGSASVIIAQSFCVDASVQQDEQLLQI